MKPLGRFDRIGQEQGHGKGTHSTRNGGQERGEGLDLCKNDISGEPVPFGLSGVVQVRQPHVDDNGSGLDHVAPDQSGNAGGTDQDFRVSGVKGQVLGVRVAERHGGVLVRQQVRQGTSHQRAAPHDRYPCAREHHLVVFQNLQDPERGAGDKAWASLSEQSGIDGVQAIDVLLRRQQGEHPVGVHSPWQGQLAEDAVDVRSRSQRLEQAFKVGLGNRRREVVIDHLQAHRFCELALGGHKARRFRMLSHLNQGQGGADSLLLQLRHFFPDFKEQLFLDVFS